MLGRLRRRRGGPHPRLLYHTKEITRHLERAIIREAPATLSINTFFPLLTCICALQVHRSDNISRIDHKRKILEGVDSGSEGDREDQVVSGFTAECSISAVAIIESDLVRL